MFANYTGADQPAHLRSLISAFVICCLESTICKLATGEISIFYLVTVAEETCLKLALPETPKTGFVAMSNIAFHKIWYFKEIEIWYSKEKKYSLIWKV